MKNRNSLNFSGLYCFSVLVPLGLKKKQRYYKSLEYNILENSPPGNAKKPDISFEKGRSSITSFLNNWISFFQQNRNWKLSTNSKRFAWEFVKFAPCSRILIVRKIQKKCYGVWSLSTFELTFHGSCGLDYVHWASYWKLQISSGGFGSKAIDFESCVRNLTVRIFLGSQWILN